ncbi:hypothetical protein J6590_035166 [Homalodisca vitripennis]|nr:hypothetical protein J6590_035166 [Homalodisca vitripennis]
MVLKLPLQTGPRLGSETLTKNLYLVPSLSELVRHGRPVDVDLLILGPSQPQPVWDRFPGESSRTELTTFST